MTPSISRAAAILSVALLGCGDTPGTAATAVRDSAGIEIIENDVDVDALPVWRLADEPSLSIGDAIPSLDYVLDRVYYARSFPDGRVLVSMGLTEMRIFDAEGTHLRTIGREGEGPGEFLFLWDAHPLGDDRIRALDIRNRRVGFFDAHGGELLGEVPLVTHWSNPNGVGLLADGRYAGVLPRYSSDPPGTPDLRLVVHDRDATASDTIAAFSVPDRPQPREGVQAMYEPYFSSTAAGMHVWAGWEGHYEVKRYDADTGLDRIIRSSVPALPVTSEMEDAGGPSVSEGPVTWDRVYPNHLPYWDKVLASPSGWLWVRRYPSPIEDEHNTWDVFDPSGVHTALIRIPLSARISELGDDYVLGVFRN
ncbi:MAG: 6-bladed beta-propeller [Phycisphaerales bacterium JB038]